MAISVSGLAPSAAHNLVVKTLKAIAGAGDRVAVVTAHPPAPNRPAAGIGGTYLCDLCSPGTSRVAWPCPPYLAAAGRDVTGLV